MSRFDESPATTAEFMEWIEMHLGRCRLDEAKDLVRTLARDVPPETRQKLLQTFYDPTPSTEPDFALGRYPVPADQDPDIERIEQVESFVRKLEDGHYYTGYGWDEEQHEERAWGDDSWAKEMDELLGQAATCYLEGNKVLAARLYGRLLGTFRHADREGIFCGPDAPEQMVQTDLNEAKRRYLRSIYEITDPNDRPARLLREMETLQTVGDQGVAIRPMTETDSDGAPPLAEVDLFLPRWIEALRSIPVDSGGFGREARRLLREAVELYKGVEGLGELAQTDGAQHPEVYHDWVGLLVRMERLTEATKAAREGVDRIQDPAYRARLADRLASLAVAQSNEELVIEATRAAWRASPTVVRLLHLVAAATEDELGTALLTQEAANVLRPTWNHSDALACRLLLLVGRHEEALTRFQRADALGWGRPDHAGSVVLPFLLVAAAGRSTPPENSTMDALWQALDKPGRNYFDRRLLLDQMTTGIEGRAHLLESERPYSELLRDALAKYPAPEVYRPRMLAAAQRKVESVVGEILHGQLRRGHALAAQLTAGVGEGIALLQTPEDGRQFARSLQRKYNQYVVFTETLEDVIRSSSVLRDPTPPTQRPSLVIVK